MRAAISRWTLEQLLADVALSTVEERCGLLLGSGNLIRAIVPARNVHPDPQSCFELDPAVLLPAERVGRGTGRAVIGHYHSHPHGCAAPSATDAEMARADGRYWLIAGAGGAFALWQSVASGALHGRFNQLVLDILDEDCH